MGSWAKIDTTSDHKVNPLQVLACDPHHELHILTVWHRDPNPLSVFAHWYSTWSITIHRNSWPSCFSNNWYTSILNAYFNVYTMATAVYCFDSNFTYHIDINCSICCSIVCIDRNTGVWNKVQIPAIPPMDLIAEMWQLLFREKLWAIGDKQRNGKEWISNDSVVT